MLPWNDRNLVRLGQNNSQFKIEASPKHTVRIEALSIDFRLMPDNCDLIPVNFKTESLNGIYLSL